MTHMAAGHYAAPLQPLEPPPTDSLLARFGLRAGDRVLGKFLVGDSGNQWRWYKGVLDYNTVEDERFMSCVYCIEYEDGETLFYSVELMREQLESGRIRKDA